MSDVHQSSGSQYLENKINQKLLIQYSGHGKLQFKKFISMNKLSRYSLVHLIILGSKDAFSFYHTFNTDISWQYHLYHQTKFEF